jgi:hypothetical protein
MRRANGYSERAKKWGGCVKECNCEAKNMVNVLTIFSFYFVHRLIFNTALCFESRLCFRLQAGKSPNLVDPQNYSQ